MNGERPLTQLGEFGLIDRIARIAPAATAVVGIGDDAAVLKNSSGGYLLATVDMLVEGVHFPHAVDPVTLGRRALAVNLSDIAAMGGTPTFVLISLALPETTAQSFVEGLYQGLAQEAALYGVGIVGGNVTRTPGPFAIDVCLLGDVPEDQVILRSGAKPGDVLVVTGVLGGATASRLMREASGGRGEDCELPVPEPRVGAGRSLASHHLAHAMIDLSDGLGSDVHHLAEQSGVGAVIYEERLPVAIGAKEAAHELGLDPRELALFGGEDYELLAAIPADQLSTASSAVGDLSLYEIGTVLRTDQGVVIERTGGLREALPSRGWKHF